MRRLSAAGSRRSVAEKALHFKPVRTRSASHDHVD
jgi:hypothetical protein